MFYHFTLHQATDTRGRVTSRVRPGPLGLTLDVPDGDALLAWAAAPFKPLAGQVVFFDLAAHVPHETIAFAAGQCVGYREDFADTGLGRRRARPYQILPMQLITTTHE